MFALGTGKMAAAAPNTRSDSKPMSLPAFVSFEHPNEDDYKSFLQHLIDHNYQRRHVVFSVEPKKGHPWENRIEGDWCFSVDGLKGDTLLLYRGYRYFITFRPEAGAPDGNSACPVFFTADPMGGPGQAPIADMPGAMGRFKTVSFIVGDDLPVTFHYQSTTRAFLGGIVHILGKPSNQKDLSEISEEDKKSGLDKHHHPRAMTDRERIFDELEKTRGAESSENVRQRRAARAGRARAADKRVERDVKPHPHNQSIRGLTKQKAEQWVEDKRGPREPHAPHAPHQGHRHQDAVKTQQPHGARGKPSAGPRKPYNPNERLRDKL